MNLSKNAGAIIQSADVVIKDQMIDQKTALNNIQSSSLMTANLIQGNTADVRVLVTSCSEMKSDIAVLKDRRDVWIYHKNSVDAFDVVPFAFNSSICCERR